MLFLDEHLSPKLVARLKDIYPGITQSLYEGMLGTLDPDVWRYATKKQLHIITKDGKDFTQLLEKHGSPPKLIILKVGNCSVKKLETILIRKRIEIMDFLNSKNKSLLEIR